MHPMATLPYSSVSAVTTDSTVGTVTKHSALVCWTTVGRLVLSAQVVKAINSRPVTTVYLDNLQSDDYAEVVKFLNVLAQNNQSVVFNAGSGAQLYAALPQLPVNVAITRGVNTLHFQDWGTVLKIIQVADLNSDTLTVQYRAA
jgi:hypothetical protein